MFTLTLTAPGISWAPITLEPDGKWHYVGGSFGVRLFQTGPNDYALRMENGANAPVFLGGFVFETIRLTCPGFVEIAPRIAHRSSNGTGGTHYIEIGNGAEYFPPRAIKTVRFVLVPWWRRLYGTLLGWLTHPQETWRAIYDKKPKVRRHTHLALPIDLMGEKARYDGYGERMLKALRTGQPDPGVGLNELLGCWMPAGLPDKGAVGGDGIEPFPAWERSPLFRLLAHDLTMERMAVSNVNYLTGEPLHARIEGYRATRGWGKTTQLADFSKTLTGHVGEDQRIPRDLNSGSVAYRDRLVPSDDMSTFYKQRYLPHDDEHLVRATRHAKACALLYGDPVAALDLEMIAADAWAGCSLPTLDPDHDGSDNVGRGLAWTLDALLACGKEWARDAALTICGELLRVQDTESGSYQAFVFGKDYGHSPSPWAMPPQYGPSMPHEFRAAHTLEVAYLATGVFLAGYSRSAYAAARFLSKDQPRQWIAVEDPGVQVGNVESFSCWGMWGALGMKSDMKRMVPPGGQAVAGEDPLFSLLLAHNYEASAKAVEALE